MRRKPRYTGRITFVVPPDFETALREIAHAERVSVARFVKDAVWNALPEETRAGLLPILSQGEKHKKPAEEQPQ